MKRKFTSPRVWISWLLAIIVIVILYFVFAEHITPTTNDASVQSFAVKVAPQVSGRIVKVFVKNNQQVKEGQPLFEIYQRPYQLALQIAESKLLTTKDKVAGLKEATDKARESIAAAQADLVTAQEHYSELHTLRKTGFVSQSRMTDASKTLADSRARLAQAKQSLRVALFALGGSVNQPINDNIHVKLAVAERDLAKLHLSETTVRAPYAGQIVNLHTAVGNYANKGSAQMTVVERNAWWVQANIKENNLAGVQVGNKALVSLSLYPGHVFSATVTGVGKGVNLNATVPANYLPYIEKSHNWVRLAQRFPVQLKLDKLSKKYPLRVGASATVTIFTCDSWFWNSLGGIWQWVRSEFSYFS